MKTIAAAALALLGLAAAGRAEREPAAAPWPMFAGDAGRTARSPLAGPVSAEPLLDTLPIPGGLSINMQPVVTAGGAYFGTWGLLRKAPGTAPDAWEKSDGRYYGVSLDPSRPIGKRLLFPPLLPGRVPVGYRRPGQARLPRDVFWCGVGNDFLVTFANGTIEGTPAVDPETGLHYVGRGDGRLYAIDPARGRVRWAFKTFDPEHPDHPDGGGEIVGGPVIAPDGSILFGTVGVPWPGKPGDPAHETNAVYAVGRDGRLRWRYPAKASSLDNWVYTPIALSPDGRTAYFGTMGGDLTKPGRVVALDLGAPADAPDERRRRWEVELRHAARAGAPPIHVRSIAVGPSGRIYVAGHALHFGGSSPVVFALHPDGRFVWDPPVVEPCAFPSRDGGVPGGLALDVREGREAVLHVTTTHVGRRNAAGGALVAIDPADGRILARFRPEDHGGFGGMTPPVVDRDGRVYAGCRGRHPEGKREGIGGRMYGLSLKRETDGRAAAWRVLFGAALPHQLDWAAPAIAADGVLCFGATAPYPPFAQAKFHPPGEDPPAAETAFHTLRDPPR